MYGLFLRTNQWKCINLLQWIKGFLRGENPQPCLINLLKACVNPKLMNINAQDSMVSAPAGL